MKFDILTIFPKIFESYFSHSLMARAQKLGLIKITSRDIREFTTDKHKTVDDRPYGGGVGMVMKVDVIDKALKALSKRKAKSARLPARQERRKVILVTPQGKTFNQKHAKRLAKFDRLVLISGRYEGYDERIRKLVDEEISIGDYILTGGELPAMVIIDTVARLVPGVVGKEQSIVDESFSEGLLEYPQYTRPAIYKKMKVPKVLFTGNHAKIEKWRRGQALIKTKKQRPDLLNLTN